MAANQAPIFPLTARVAGVLVGGTALTARTAISGTTGLTLLAASGTFGSRWDQIILSATGTTLAGLINLWVYDGTTSRLFDEYSVTVVTASTTVPGYRLITSYTTLVLPSTHSLYCSSQVGSQLITVFAVGGDY